jgi:hypothetical protein
LLMLMLFAEGTTAARGSVRFLIVGVGSDTDAPSHIDIEMRPMMSATSRRRDPAGNVMVVQVHYTTVEVMMLARLTTP